MRDGHPLGEKARHHVVVLAGPEVGHHLFGGRGDALGVELAVRLTLPCAERVASHQPLAQGDHVGGAGHPQPVVGAAVRGDRRVAAVHQGIKSRVRQAQPLHHGVHFVKSGRRGVGPLLGDGPADRLHHQVGRRVVAPSDHQPHRVAERHGKALGEVLGQQPRAGDLVVVPQRHRVVQRQQPAGGRVVRGDHHGQLDEARGGHPLARVAGPLPPRRQVLEPGRDLPLVGVQQRGERGVQLLLGGVLGGRLRDRRGGGQHRDRGGQQDRATGRAGRSHRRGGGAGPVGGKTRSPPIIAARGDQFASSSIRTPLPGRSG